MTYEYHLLVNWNLVNKRLKKYPKDVKSRVKRNISLLKYNAKKGIRLDAFKTASLWKKRYEEVEVYYTIEDLAVVVLEVRYIGTVKLKDIVGNIKSGKHKKKTTTKQQRVIKFQKKKFRKGL